MISRADTANRGEVSSLIDASGVLLDDAFDRSCFATDASEASLRGSFESGGGASELSFVEEDADLWMFLAEAGRGSVMLSCVSNNLEATFGSCKLSAEFDVGTATVPL